MKYFVTDRERDGTCYHEFYKGRWDGKTFCHQRSGIFNALSIILPLLSEPSLQDVTLPSHLHTSE
nr:hypothetical protein [uncultured Roseburia sp.]